MKRTRALVGLIFAFVALAATAAPSSAAPPPTFNAKFAAEQTLFRPCPPGVPTGALCFTGSDRSGTITSPPIPKEVAAREDYVGFVDVNHPILPAPVGCPPNANGTPPAFPDHNTVVLSTRAGRLFLTTDGVNCTTTGVDHGIWRVTGGTGVFTHARGSGTVVTQALGGTGAATDPINSMSTYTGLVTLR